MVTEPTAAAIAYGLHQRNIETKFLVFDLGGGTFDVSILEIFENIMEVRAVAEDNYLGGEDFTDALVTLFLQYHALTMGELSSKEYSMLKKQAELAKRSFNLHKFANINTTIGKEVYSFKISLDEYEQAVQPLIPTMYIAIITLDFCLIN